MTILCSVIVALASATAFVSGFSFNVSTPTQCGALTVQWDGGDEPFHLLLVPTISVPSGRILNITLPTGLSDRRYTFDLNEPAGLQFLMTMYDRNGFGTGGTTGVLTVGSSDNSSCLDSNLLYDFYFYTSTNTPTQCNTMSISWNNNVTTPVNLFGLIPSGTAFQLPISQNPSQSASYDWPVNIASGTEFLLFMSDNGPYQTGGSTPLLNVGSGSTGCMNDTSPRTGGSSGNGSTSGGGTTAGVGGGSSGGNSGGGGGGGGDGAKTNTGAIVGGAVGGVAFIVLLAIMLFFCCRRRARERRGSGETSLVKNYGAPSPNEKRSRFDILSGGSRRGRRASDQETRVGEEGYEPSPFKYPSPPQASDAPGRNNGAGQNMAAISAGAHGAQRADKEREALGADNGTNRHSHVSDATATGTPKRQSYESSHTPLYGHGIGTENSSSMPRTPMTEQSPAQYNGLFPQSLAGSQGNGTDLATVGHGPGGEAADINRRSSIVKTPGHAIPATPTTPMGRRGVDEAVAGGEHGGADVRFVEHRDMGPVVDLPPRYDQLRARNPDGTQ